MEGVMKRCLIEMLRGKYKNSRKKVKGELISELCQAIKVSRKHAIRLLRPQALGRPRKSRRQGRPGRYQDINFKRSLGFIWKLLKYPCGRTLKAAIPLWLDAIESSYGHFSIDIHERLLSVSAATIDRLLKPYKLKRGRSYTRSGGFRDEIPIQGPVWDIRIPGYIESDTAAMCGGSSQGEFANGLTIVDLASLWTEVRFVFGKGSNAVFDALRDIEHHLPFSLLGYDADNGGEVLNRQIFDYFYTERIKKGQPPVLVTRSREYQKNDNAYVEQRNDSLVRKYLGYERMDFRQLIPLLNYYYACIVCPLVNHFIPVFRLKDKKRIKSRTRRVYAAPQTPYQRLMDSPHLSTAQKLKLQLQHDSLNPVRLAQAEVKFRKLIDACLKRLRGNAALPERLPSYALFQPLLPNALAGTEHTEQV